MGPLEDKECDGKQVAKSPAHEAKAVGCLDIGRGLGDNAVNLAPRCKDIAR